MLGTISLSYWLVYHLQHRYVSMCLSGGPARLGRGASVKACLRLLKYSSTTSLTTVASPPLWSVLGSTKRQWMQQRRPTPLDPGRRLAVIDTPSWTLSERLSSSLGMLLLCGWEGVQIGSDMRTPHCGACRRAGRPHQLLPEQRVL